MQGLQTLGWTLGRNVRVDTRWSAGDTDRYRKHAAELVALAPDVLLASNTSTVRALRQVTPTVPIVFATSVDPVGSGLVAALARPASNVTGFAAFDFGMSAKLLELLKEIAPHVTRVAVIRDSNTTGGIAQFGALQSVASSFSVELSPVDVRSAGELEQAIRSFAHSSNGALIVVSTAGAAGHRDLIATLSGRHRLPAVFSDRSFIAGGGLLSYGPDRGDQFRRAAGYVDRILKGEKPADLPVQAPTKYELVINLKTAKAIGLTVPDTLLARADEVIE
jgi:putative ABC transport system substrate-binding protein